MAATVPHAPKSAETFQPTAPQGIGIRTPAYGAIRVSSRDINLSRRVHRVNYPVSNEEPDPEVEKTLAKPLGIERYLGIAGGMTHSLDLIAMMLTSNPLSSIVLFDRDPRQLLNAKNIADIFNRTDESGYPEALEKYTEQTRRRTDEFPRWQKPKITKDIEIVLQRADAIRHIKSITEQAIYYIYLSNILQWYGSTRQGLKAVREIMGGVRTNASILDGSIVHIQLFKKSVSCDPYILLLRKFEGQLFIMSTDLSVSGPVSDEEIASRL